jgi:hypothetical protein
MWKINHKLYRLLYVSYDRDYFNRRICSSVLVRRYCKAANRTDCQKYQYVVHMTNIRDDYK